MKTYQDWRNVPEPERMAALPTDERGYPIPVVVTIGLDGTPFFTINNQEVVQRCAKEFRCHICGQPLDDNDMAFVGGPLSAFHPRGGIYIDGAMHIECARYALQVCPYLAAPKYVKRIDAAKVTADNLKVAVMEDPTMLPERPDFFVLIRSMSYTYDGQYFRPMGTGNQLGRWHDFEIWKHGVRIESKGKVRRMCMKAMKESTQKVQMLQKPRFIKLRKITDRIDVPEDLSYTTVM